MAHHPCRLILRQSVCTWYHCGTVSRAPPVLFGVAKGSPAPYHNSRSGRFSAGLDIEKVTLFCIDHRFGFCFWFSGLIDDADEDDDYIDAAEDEY